MLAAVAQPTERPQGPGPIFDYDFEIVVKYVYSQMAIRAPGLHHRPVEELLRLGLLAVRGDVVEPAQLLLRGAVRHYTAVFLDWTLDFKIEISESESLPNHEPCPWDPFTAWIPTSIVLLLIRVKTNHPCCVRRRHSGKFQSSSSLPRERATDDNAKGAGNGPVGRLASPQGARSDSRAGSLRIARRATLRLRVLDLIALVTACTQGVPHSIQQAGAARYPLDESPRSSAEFCLSLCVVTASLPDRQILNPNFGEAQFRQQPYDLPLSRARGKAGIAECVVPLCQRECKRGSQHGYKRVSATANVAPVANADVSASNKE